MDINIKDIANKLYYLSCDMDFSDYGENEKEDIELIIAALESLQSCVNSYDSYKYGHYRQLLLCLERIANTN